MLSLGSGICSHEMKLAKMTQMGSVTCVDIAKNILAEAEKIAVSSGIHNMHFIVSDIWDLDLPRNSYDIIFFHASLHHFSNLEELLNRKLKPTLKKRGYVVINEYVGPNRMQYPRHQIQAINEALHLIPVKYRKRFKRKVIKNYVSGPGLWRMILADPSECIESENILPLLRKHFTKLEEKSYGGNIIAPALKDIAHHFVVSNDEKMRVLMQLFDCEDAYLKKRE